MKKIFGTFILTVLLFYAFAQKTFKTFHYTSRRIGNSIIAASGFININIKDSTITFSAEPAKTFKYTNIAPNESTYGHTAIHFKELDFFGSNAKIKSQVIQVIRQYEPGKENTLTVLINNGDADADIYECDYLDELFSEN